MNDRRDEWLPPTDTMTDSEEYASDDSVSDAVSWYATDDEQLHEMGVKLMEIERDEADRWEQREAQIEEDEPEEAGFAMKFCPRCEAVTKVNLSVCRVRCADRCGFFVAPSRWMEAKDAP